MDDTRGVNGTRARSAQEWGAILPQWLGMAGVIFCALFWAATTVIDPPGKIEPLLLSAFGGLIATGQAASAVVALKQSPPTAPPVPDKTVGDSGAA